MKAYIYSRSTLVACLAAAIFLISPAAAEVSCTPGMIEPEEVREMQHQALQEAWDEYDAARQAAEDAVQYLRDLEAAALDDEADLPPDIFRAEIDAARNESMRLRAEADSKLSEYMQRSAQLIFLQPPAEPSNCEEQQEAGAEVETAPIVEPEDMPELVESADETALIEEPEDIPELAESADDAALSGAEPEPVYYEY